MVSKERSLFVFVAAGIVVARRARLCRRAHRRRARRTRDAGVGVARANAIRMRNTRVCEPSTASSCVARARRRDRANPRARRAKPPTIRFVRIRFRRGNHRFRFHVDRRRAPVSVVCAPPRDSDRGPRGFGGRRVSVRVRRGGAAARTPAAETRRQEKRGRRGQDGDAGEARAALSAVTRA